MKKLLLAANLFLGAALVTGLTGTAYADSADVLPKGRSRVNVSSAYYFPIDTRFDPDGDDEDIASDYNRTLNTIVFPDLAIFEVSSGFLVSILPDGTANVGDTNISFEIKATELSIDYQYGLTDKLTVGLYIPYSWYKREVRSELITTDANVGFNPDYGQPGDLFGIPLIPIALGGVALSVDDVKDMLSDVYGYERFETWSDDGIGDIMLGGRYQYFNNDQWRLAFTGGVRMPTGDADNPDNLLDMAFGADAWALLFQFQNDYIATENLVLNFTLKYDLVLPDHEILRVPPSVDIPITPDKEEVDRDTGDQFKFDTSATYTFSDGFSGSIQYQYWHRLKDSIDGNQGFAYESLEDETDTTAHMFLTGVSYSTIPAFLEKKFPVPLVVSITYENVFAGSNDFLKQQDIIFNLSVFF